MGTQAQEVRTMKLTTEECKVLLPAMQRAIRRQIDLWHALRDIESILGQEPTGLDLAIESEAVSIDEPEKLGAEWVGTVMDVLLKDYCCTTATDIRAAIEKHRAAVPACGGED
jgi:hypothetical protein